MHPCVMTSTAKQMARDILALSEEDRLEILALLASSLPSEKAAIAESARRAAEMRNDTVKAMTVEEFRGKMENLKVQLRNPA